MKRYNTIVFTDIDGTFLSENNPVVTKKVKENERILAKKHVLLIFTTSKSYPLVRELQKKLHITAPFIFENGGGIFWPKYFVAPHFDTKQYPVVTVKDGSIFCLAKSSSQTKEVVERELRKAKLLTDSVVPDFPLTDRQKEILHKNFPSWIVRQTKKKLPRFFDIGVGFGQTTSIKKIEAFLDSLQKKKFSVTSGGLFYHIVYGSDKARAVKILQQFLLKNPTNRTIGIGNAESDLSFLKQCEAGYLLGKDIEKTLLKNYKVNDKITPIQQQGPLGFEQALQKEYVI